MKLILQKVGFLTALSHSRSTALPEIFVHVGTVVTPQVLLVDLERVEDVAALLGT
jgi:hypothetical protein